MAKSERQNSKPIKRIFISHATKDEFITSAFIDLILDTGLAIDIVKDVFCTSYDGTKIKTGTDWRESIRGALENASVVFLFISPYYKESEICQNEMGAAWVLNSNTVPFMIEPITYDTVGVLAEVKQIAKLFDDKALDEIKDKLVEELQLQTSSISSARWTAKKTEFLLKCKDYLSKPENKYPSPLSRSEMDKLIKEKGDLQATVMSQLEENEKMNQKMEALKKIKDKVEVSKVDAEFEGKGTFEEFESKALVVARLLQQNKGIINGIIFNDYFRKGLTIDWQSYGADIDDAVSLNQIDGEELSVNWENRLMKKIKQALDEFYSYMYQINDDEDFLEQFDTEYKCDFELNNLLFWRKVFFVSVYVN